MNVPPAVLRRTGLAGAVRRATPMLLALTVAGASGCVSTVPRETILPVGGLAIETITPDGRPVVEAYINGEGPFVFMLDTGAVPILIDEAIAQRLALPELPWHEWVGVTPEGRETTAAPMVRIDSVHVGGATFRGVVGVARDISRYDGILGMALFTECTLTIDLRGSTVRLDTIPLDPDDPWTVRSPPADGTPTIPVTIREADTVFECTPTLDTGAIAGIELPLAVLDALDFEQTAWVRAVSAAGASRHPRGIITGTMTLGPGITITDPEATLLDGPGLVGVRFLRDYLVSVDIRRGLVRLAPHPARNEGADKDEDESASP